MLNIQTEQGDKVMWSRFPLYFDLRLSSHSLIHIDRSRPREQTRAFAIKHRASYVVTQSICFIGGMWGGGGKRNQASNPPTPPLFPPIQWPCARRPSKTQLWQRMSDCSRKCFRRAVKVCTGGSRALSMRMTCAVAEQIQQLSRVWGPNGQGFKSRL